MSRKKYANQSITYIVELYQYGAIGQKWSLTNLHNNQVLYLS